jgi:NADPH:quinone reductase-like Zn-dependent oxidoreductase
MSGQSLPQMRALYATPAPPAPISTWTWQVGTVPVPTLGPASILIRIHAAGLRHADLSDAHFYKSLADTSSKLPACYVPGTDVSGVVMSVASDVKGFSAGDEVIAMINKGDGGGCAEMVVVPVLAVWPKPSAMCHAEAAAIGTDGLAALQALEEAARHLPMVSPFILVTGAAAGAGILIAQAAKALHNVHLTVVYRDRAAVKVLEKLGADSIVYLAPDVSILDRLRAATFDVAFDTAGIAYKVSVWYLVFL